MKNYSMLFNKDIINDMLFVDLQIAQIDNNIDSLSPELCKIICITYGTCEKIDGEIKRGELKTITSDDEFEIIQKFVDVLNYYHNLSTQRSIPYQMYLCGEDVDGIILPEITNRIIKYRDQLLDANNKFFPKILRNTFVGINGLITVNLRDLIGFGGYVSNYEQLIKEWGIKTSVELWSGNISTNNNPSEDVMKQIIIQSKNRVNVQMQIMKIIDMI